MASEPYLMNRKQNCYRAPLCFSYHPRLPRHDPNCTTDKYTAYFRDRWKALTQDVCKCKCKSKCMCPPHPLAKARCKENTAGLAERLSFNDICVPQMYERGITQYQKAYQYPWSHNNMDDCCKPECPCLDRFPDAPEMDYVCKGNFPCPPMEDCTTYKHFYYEKPTPPPPRRYRPSPYDPCECPLESATSYRLDYELKDPIPNGPPLAQAIKRGMWSLDQFCGDFKSDTESGDQFYRKCAVIPPAIRKPDNIKVGQGPLESSTETCSQYNLKCAEDRVCCPDWIQNDTWIPQETPLEKCTTYKHFYKAHPFRLPPGPSPPIQSPDAIPFSSMNNIWYTCCDPEVDQRVPVEMRDQDPWPRVITKPIRYQDNLQTDPCAPFRDETTYKADYFAKKRCAANKWYGPQRGYVHPVLPFNDNTTNRVSYVAYSNDQRAGARQNSGNPNGIKWGPYKCPPEVDKCRPPFPPPYGHPIKPYTKQCPCGQFDDRSMYHRDFKFWTPEMTDSIYSENCKELKLPQGLSLYRASYGYQVGKKAAVMPPPKSKGHRCMTPCNFIDLDSLSRLSFIDFYKAIPRQSLEKYRGNPTIKIRRKKNEGDENCEAEAQQNHFEIFQMPKGSTVEDTLLYLQQQQNSNKK